MFRCRGNLAAIREEQQILKIVANATEVGKMIMAPPAMPADRVQALRRAFDATMKDPEFVAELKANRVELGPMAGEDLQKLVAELGARFAGDPRQGQGDLSAELSGGACFVRSIARIGGGIRAVRADRSATRSRSRTSTAARRSR